MGRIKHPRYDRHFALIPLHVIESAEWHALKFSARCVLVAIASQFTRKNNGDLTMTDNDGVRLGIPRHDTNVYACKALLESGLIVKSHQGGRKPNGPTCYALPWHDLHFLGNERYGYGTMNHPKKLDQPRPAQVWIREKWALKNISTGTETGPRDDTDTGPRQSPEWSENRTAVGDLDGPKTVPPSKTLPRGSASLACQEHESYERSEKREMKR